MLNKYIAKNRPPSEFENWMKNHLVYEAAKLSIAKPFLGKESSSITKAQLLEFLRNIPLQNEKALANSAYYSFIARWIESIYMILSNDRNYNDLSSAASRSLEILDGDYKGIAREIAYYNSYSWSANSELAAFRLEQVWDRFDSVITDNFVQQALELKRSTVLQQFVPFSVADKLRKLSTDSFAIKNLLSILEKEKGRFIYIDFWGKWCAPCMADMPYYRAFIEQFNDKQIIFLFLGVKTSTTDSKAVQQRFAIPGKFLILNEMETTILNQVFGFSSYPSRFIIDPKGNAVTKNIRPLNPKDAADLIKMMIKKEGTQR
jgi:thiol-disulfide isomerase/thioredoxin